MVAQPETRGDLMKMGSADEMSFHFRQSAFRIIGMPGDEGFACQEAENRIAQKLELLVIGGRFRILLIHPRLVCESPLQKFPAVEMMPDNRFELFDRGRYGFGEAPVAWFRSKNSNLPEAWLRPIRPFVLQLRPSWLERWI